MLKRNASISLIIILLFVVGCNGQPDKTGDRKVEMKTERGNNTAGSAQVRGGGFKADKYKQIFEKTDIFPTKFFMSSGYVDLTLNGDLVIKSIKVNQQVGGVRWPQNNDDLTVVEFKNKQLKEALAAAVTHEKTYSRQPELKLGHPTKTGGGRGPVKAKYSVPVNDVLALNGIKLMKTDGDFWLAWPQEKGKDRWYDLLGGQTLRDKLLKKCKKAYQSGAPENSEVSKLNERGKKKAKVIEVYDGDTFKARLVGDRGKKITVRINGINCPESKRNDKCEEDDFWGYMDCSKQIPYGKRASRIAENWLKGKYVTLSSGKSKPLKEGEYGRTIAYVQLPSGDDYGLKMIKNGYCRDTSKSFSHPRGSLYQQNQAPLKPLDN